MCSTDNISIRSRVANFQALRSMLSILDSYCDYHCANSFAIILRASAFFASKLSIYSLIPFKVYRKTCFWLPSTSLVPISDSPTVSSFGVWSFYLTLWRAKSYSSASFSCPLSRATVSLLLSWVSSTSSCARANYYIVFSIWHSYYASRALVALSWNSGGILLILSFRWRFLVQ